MKKFFLTFASLLLCVAAALAVPAKPGMWRSIQLSDGTVVRAELRGDEHASWYRSEDGRCFIKSEENNCFIERDAAALSSEMSQLISMARRAESAAPNKASYIGTKKCLVILAEFPDCQFSFDLEQHQKLVNQQNYSDEELGFVGSVRDWFYSQSYGQFDIEFDVVGPYTMKNNYAYYGGHSTWGNDSHAGDMIKEACQAANPYVNYQDYDWDGNGAVELVFVIYAGRGEASGGNENTIWPHKSSISTRLDNVRISTYACSCELRGGGVNRADESESETPLINGIGTICHEFSHCLGLPDYYDVNYGDFEGMGFWDVMCNGPYLGDSFIPCGYTAYERNYCGWCPIVELKNDTVVTDMPAITAEPKAYAMYNDANRNEFFVIENRQKTGWDAALYGSGLLAYHVDYDPYVWTYNIVNTVADYGSISNDHERCTFVPADNKKAVTSASGIAGDLYPYKTNKSLSYNTLPATEIYTPCQNRSILYKGLYNIAKSGSTVSFEYKDCSDEMNGPEAPAGSLFYESFYSCLGTGGNDNVFGGTSTGTGAFTPDNEWTSSNAYGADKCAKFGTGLAKGAATTSAIDLGSTLGLYELTFRSAPFKGDKNNNIKVDVAGSNVMIADSVGILDAATREAMSQASITAPYAGQEQWTDFKLYVYGKGSIKLTFTAGAKRMFLDEVLLMPSDLDLTTAIEQVESDETPAVRYNLQGQKLNSVGRGQLFIENGRIVIK